MNDALALHFAARRYCQRELELLEKQHAQVRRIARRRQGDGHDYDADALLIDARSAALEAILIDLERLDPAVLDDLQATRDLLILAGLTAHTRSTRSFERGVQQAAVGDAREAFCCYIRELTMFDLAAIEPLPYRRVLAAGEASEIWVRMRDRWNIARGCYWYPLDNCTLPNVFSFEANDFDSSGAVGQVRDILKGHGIERLWELREFQDEDYPEYELSVTLLDPYYNGTEGYWSSGDLDWLLYASHEGSLSVAGWLLPELQARWPSWQTHRWLRPHGSG